MQEIVIGLDVAPRFDGGSARRIREVVAASFAQTAAAQSRDLRPLDDELALLDSGLDSLCFAIIVAQLEDEFGVDPFADLDDGAFPVTFGNFVQLYESAVLAGAPT